MFRQVLYHRSITFYRSCSLWFLLGKGKWFTFRRMIFRSLFFSQARSRRRLLLPGRLRWWRCCQGGCRPFLRLFDGMSRRLTAVCKSSTRARSLRKVCYWVLFDCGFHRWEDTGSSHKWCRPHHPCRRIPLICTIFPSVALDYRFREQDQLVLPINQISFYWAIWLDFW